MTPSFVFFGNNSSQSLLVFKQLIESGLNPRLVVLPGTCLGDHVVLAWQPLASEVNLQNIAQRQGIPVIHLERSPAPENISHLAEHFSDWFLLCCYPYRLPSSIYDLPVKACVNLHPSTLPAYRGPSPVFWQLRNGADSIGVSLHYVTAQVDGGNIIANSHVSLHDFPLRSNLQQRIASVGVGLFRKLIMQNSRLTVGQTQLNQDESYAPIPANKNYVIPTTWDAIRAWRFLRGVWPAPKSLIIDDVKNQSKYNVSELLLLGKTKYNTNADKSGDETALAFRDGVIKIRVSQVKH